MEEDRDTVWGKPFRTLFHYLRITAESNERCDGCLGYSVHYALVQEHVYGTPTSVVYEVIQQNLCTQILFLNKEDLFREKVLTSSIKQHFPVSLYAETHLAPPVVNYAITGLQWTRRRHQRRNELLQETFRPIARRRNSALSCFKKFPISPEATQRNYASGRSKGLPLVSKLSACLYICSNVHRISFTTATVSSKYHLHRVHTWQFLGY